MNPTDFEHMMRTLRRIADGQDGIIVMLILVLIVLLLKGCVS